MKNSNAVKKSNHKLIGHLTFFIDQNREVVVGTRQSQNYTVRVYVDRQSSQMLYVSIDKAGKKLTSAAYPIVSAKRKEGK